MMAFLEKPIDGSLRGDRGDRLSYDHVVPKYRGGGANWENIVMSCYSRGVGTFHPALTPLGFGLF